jgi:hypothetical protein
MQAACILLQAAAANKNFYLNKNQAALSAT